VTHCVPRNRQLDVPPARAGRSAASRRRSLLLGRRADTSDAKPTLLCGEGPKSLGVHANELGASPRPRVALRLRQRTWRPAIYSSRRDCKCIVRPVVRRAGCSDRNAQPTPQQSLAHVVLHSRLISTTLLRPRRGPSARWLAHCFRTATLLGRRGPKRIGWAPGAASAPANIDRSRGSCPLSTPVCLAVAISSFLSILSCASDERAYRAEYIRIVLDIRSVPSYTKAKAPSHGQGRAGDAGSRPGGRGGLGLCLMSCSPLLAALLLELACTLE